MTDATYTHPPMSSDTDGNGVNRVATYLEGRDDIDAATRSSLIYVAHQYAIESENDALREARDAILSRLAATAPPSGTSAAEIAAWNAAIARATAIVTDATPLANE